MKPSTEIIDKLFKLDSKELYEMFMNQRCYNEIRSDTERLMSITKTREEYKSFIVYRLLLHVSVKAKIVNHELEEYAKKAIGDLLESLSLPRDSFVKITMFEIIIYEHLK